jgi:hypothetical protein
VPPSNGADFKVFSKEFKIEKKWNCSRAHRRYQEISQIENLQPMK